MSTIYSTSAKFILCGEHFVVRGMASFVIPARCFEAVLTLTETPERRGVSAHCRFDIEQPLSDDRKAECEETLSGLVRHAMAWFGIDEKSNGYCFDLKSTIPPGQGAGSSSAVCQAVVGCLLKHFFGLRNVAPQYLMTWSRMLETWLHGEVSGADNAAIAYGAPLSYIRSESLKAHKPNAPAFFVVGSAGARVSSPYEIVSQFKRSNPLLYRNCGNEACMQALDMASAMEAGDFAQVGDRMTKNHSILRDIGLSTPKIEEAASLAMRENAFGAKLTGAGCGGFVIALAPVQSVEKIQRAWLRAGLSNVRCLQFLPAAG